MLWAYDKIDVHLHALLCVDIRYSVRVCLCVCTGGCFTCCGECAKMRDKIDLKMRERVGVA